VDDILVNKYYFRKIWASADIPQEDVPEKCFTACRILLEELVDSVCAE
jgi:hypothetical protein